MLDGGEVSEGLVDALVAAGAGPSDVRTRLCRGSAGFGAALGRATPNAQRQRRVFEDPATGCVVGLDGRLDNLIELRAQLGRRGAYRQEFEALDDAEWVLAAYLRWGEASPNKLRGDFAIALWDPRRPSLVLARDPLGVRPLHYSVTAGGIAFASTVEQLLCHPAVDRSVDDDFALAHLYAAPFGAATLFRGIHAVPGGHYVLFGPTGVRSRRYWHWPSSPPRRRATVEDMLEFRTLFLDAVRDRLRSSGEVGVLLSGGLDSGSVACAAGHLSRDESLPKIRAYSFVFERFLSCDERLFSKAVTNRYQLAHSTLLSDHLWTLSRLEEWIPFFTEPWFGPYDDAIRNALAAARADGVSVMLMGHGGDTLFPPAPRHLAGWFLRGRWPEVQRELRADARVRRRRYLRSFAANVALPLLPTPLRRFQGHPGIAEMRRWMPEPVRQRLPARPPNRHFGGEAWWYELHDRLARSNEGPHHTFLDRMMRRFDLEVRHPFLDVRLIEFALRSPPEVLYSNGLPKHVLRESLSDILPDPIRLRGDKADFRPLLDYGVRHRRREFVERLLDDSELGRRGYVLTRPWRESCLRFLSGDNASPVWKSLTLEMCLRVQTGRLPSIE